MSSDANENLALETNDLQSSASDYDKQEFDDVDVMFQEETKHVNDTKIKVKRKRKKSDKGLDEDHSTGNGIEHDVEIDPDYKKKQQTKRILIGGIVGICLLLLYMVYYQMTHVSVPDFSGKTVVEAKNWATENKMKPEIKQEYSLKIDSNGIISQSIAPNKKIKKGSNITFKVSEGADPKGKIELPDFETMSKEEVEQWIKKNKAENVTIIDEYNDKIETGKFIRLEFTDKEVNKDHYLRQDIANVYFSKGKEVFEKNISVPDFRKKAKGKREREKKRERRKSREREEERDERAERGKGEGGGGGGGGEGGEGEREGKKIFLFLILEKKQNQRLKIGQRKMRSMSSSKNLIQIRLNQILSYRKQFLQKQN
ncbi:hypothetical protein BHY08_05485 [Vagococcus teuberi]|uniref:PASTA domain-containing protein n=1 Tax=Vagococcus teuberi TaxID=519472 RepID=A0A1J0A5W8_9ENTE|nr:PASTA domain-containing protein [Vagococcus teuberi]APB31328.1 hypothetical protein BHY08_05485 [Vagococcus teuberi]